MYIFQVRVIVFIKILDYYEKICISLDRPIKPNWPMGLDWTSSIDWFDFRNLGGKQNKMRYSKESGLEKKNNWTMQRVDNFSLANVVNRPLPLIELIFKKWVNMSLLQNPINIHKALIVSVLTLNPLFLTIVSYPPNLIS